MKRILVATDGSAHAARAVSLASEIAIGCHRALLIIHVVTGDALTEREQALVETEYAAELASRLAALAEASGIATPGDQPRPDWLDRRTDERTAAIRAVIGERRLAEAETAARAAGATDVHTILSHGDPAEAVLAAARENNADLIAMGSHGLGVVRGLILGSVSHKISHASACSVLIAR
jgi:nucleotide-binding universal stress UspA family protein